MNEIKSKYLKHLEQQGNAISEIGTPIKLSNQFGSNNIIDYDNYIYQFGILYDKKGTPRISACRTNKINNYVQKLELPFTSVEDYWNYFYNPVGLVGKNKILCKHAKENKLLILELEKEITKTIIKLSKKIQPLFSVSDNLDEDLYYISTEDPSDALYLFNSKTNEFKSLNIDIYKITKDSIIKGDYCFIAYYKNDCLHLLYRYDEFIHIYRHDKANNKFMEVRKFYDTATNFLMMSGISICDGKYLVLNNPIMYANHLLTLINLHTYQCYNIPLLLPANRNYKIAFPSHLLYGYDWHCNDKDKYIEDSLSVYPLILEDDISDGNFVIMDRTKYDKLKIKNNNTLYVVKDNEKINIYLGSILIK